MGCWGDFKTGQSSPPGGVKFASVSAGWFHTCGVRALDKRAECWGNKYCERGSENAPFRWSDPRALIRRS